MLMETNEETMPILSRLIERLFTIVAVSMGLYHVIATIHPFFSELQHSNVHLCFALGLLYLSETLKRTRKGQNFRAVLFLLILLAAVVSCMYIQVNYLRLVTKVGIVTGPDLVIGTMLLLIAIDASYRTFGKPLPIIVLIFILYLRFSSYLPGFFHHTGLSWPRIISSMTTNLTGIYGSILSISASTIVVFMIFGGILEASGGGRFFIDMALAIGGRMSSGPAQAAVISSLLMGSINGSATANVATTGVFTIPLMKKCGYESEMAGAVESVASSGGALMPPVMGVGAFIMSGITGIPYATVALSALIPALLYYFTVSVSVHLYSVKRGFRPLEGSDIPDIRKVLSEGWHFLLPLLSVIYAMYRGFSAPRSGFYGIITILAVTLLRRSLRDPHYILRPDFFVMIKNGLVSGAGTAMKIAPSSAVMGIVANAMILSSLAFKIMFFIKTISGNYSFVAVLLVTLITIIFGMGVPTIASYVLVAVIGAQTLVSLGFHVIAVHLFIYYYSILAGITPPVCATVLVGCQIAQSDYMKTAFRSCRLCLTGFILPFVFIYHSELVMQGPAFTIFTSTISAFVGIFSMVAALEGYFFVNMTLPRRALALVAAGCLILPGLHTDMAGYLLFTALLVWQYTSRGKPYAVT